MKVGKVRINDSGFAIDPQTLDSFTHFRVTCQINHKGRCAVMMDSNLGKKDIDPQRFLVATGLEAIFQLKPGVKSALSVKPRKRMKGRQREFNPMYADAQFSFHCSRCGVSASASIDVETKEFSYCKSSYTYSPADPLPYDKNRINCHCPEDFMRWSFRVKDGVLSLAKPDFPKDWLPHAKPMAEATK
jgi:hypothetical protein